MPQDNAVVNPLSTVTPRDHLLSSSAQLDEALCNGFEADVNIEIVRNSIRLAESLPHLAAIDAGIKE
jgi:hypothetical protein